MIMTSYCYHLKKLIMPNSTYNVTTGLRKTISMQNISPFLCVLYRIKQVLLNSLGNSACMMKFVLKCYIMKKSY